MENFMIVRTETKNYTQFKNVTPSQSNPTYIKLSTSLLIKKSRFCYLRKKNPFPKSSWETNSFFFSHSKQFHHNLEHYYRLYNLNIMNTQELFTLMNSTETKRKLAKKRRKYTRKCKGEISWKFLQTIH